MKTSAVPVKKIDTHLLSFVSKENEVKLGTFYELPGAFASDKSPEKNYRG